MADEFRKKTAANILGAATLQAGNFLVPLVLLPWLVRTLGAVGYGQIAYVTAIIAYYVMLVDWGFSLSATKSVAIHRDNPLERSRVLWVTILARFLLALGGAFALELLCFAIDILDASNYRLAYLTVWATALNPVFYYLGVEKIGRAAIIQMSIRICAIPLVMLMVESDADLTWAIGIPAGIFLLAVLVNLVVLIGSCEVQWTPLNISSFAAAYKAGWPLFLSTAAISLYTNTNTVILGLVAGNVAVGYFSSAMIFIKAAQGLYQPISQAFFPKMSHQFFHNPDGAAQVFIKLLKWQSLLTLIGSVSFFLLSPLLVSLVLGPAFATVVVVLRWMTPLILLIGLSNVLGIQGMIPLGYNRAFTRIVMVSGLINLCLVIALGGTFGAEGGAIALLVSEGCVTLMMANFLVRNEPKLFGRNV